MKVKLEATFVVLRMLLFQTAIGCTNIIPPDNAWLKRSNNDIIIGCYLSQQTWQLKCDGQEWKGQVGTCPETCMYHTFAVAMGNLILNMFSPLLRISEVLSCSRYANSSGIRSRPRHIRDICMILFFCQWLFCTVLFAL